MTTPASWRIATPGSRSRPPHLQSRHSGTVMLVGLGARARTTSLVYCSNAAVKRRGPWSKLSSKRSTSCSGCRSAHRILRSEKRSRSAGRCAPWAHLGARSARRWDPCWCRSRVFLLVLRQTLTRRRIRSADRVISSARRPSKSAYAHQLSRGQFRAGPGLTDLAAIHPSERIERRARRDAHASAGQLSSATFTADCRPSPPV